MMKSLSLAITLCCILSRSASGTTLFGIDLEDPFGFLGQYLPASAEESTAQSATTLSAGSGENVCVAGDAICEAHAKTPKLANEQGRPR